MTDSEQRRYRCEIRAILSMRVISDKKAKDYLAIVEEKRGKLVADQMRDDCREQWRRGNRGMKGDWRE